MNAGQIVKGNPVQAGGVPIGSVEKIELTDDGQADLTLSIDDDHGPLPTGTRASIRQLSQSGIANRFVDLTFPEHTRGRRARSTTAGGSAPTPPPRRSISTRC